MLSSVDINFQIHEETATILIESEVKTTGKTGVEMEAIHAVSVTAMTIYDMIKAVDRWIEITDIKLMEKSGGKSGYVKREVLSI
jgi:cyclic pyranopterin monophosphate synthase